MCELEFQLRLVCVLVVQFALEFFFLKILFICYHCCKGFIYLFMPDTHSGCPLIKADSLPLRRYLPLGVGQSMCHSFILELIIG